MAGPESVWVAFLRGINLGKRQIKMADLRPVFEALGFRAVKTILASGNVRFAGAGAPLDIRAGLEAAIERRFGFPVGIVLRSGTEIEVMLAADPFAGNPDGADVKRYVMLFADTLPQDLTLTGEPGDFDVVRIDPREVYLLAHRLPSGRYGAGMDRLDRQLASLGKDALVTTRNWNTIGKSLA